MSDMETDPKSCACEAIEEAHRLLGAPPIAGPWGYPCEMCEEAAGGYAPSERRREMEHEVIALGRATQGDEDYAAVVLGVDGTACGHCAPVRLHAPGVMEAHALVERLEEIGILARAWSADIGMWI